MNINDGTQVRGSWNNNTYHIMRKIGEGSFGQVFLVQSDLGKKLALKLSTNVVSITREYRLLSELNKNSGIKKLRALPDVVEADDWTAQDNLYRFIVVDYMEGQVLGKVIEKKHQFAEEELRELGVSLGKILSCLHGQKMVLGDLKPDNLIYEKDASIKVIDLGGVTRWGNTVEEYTPLFDRATWGMGNRIADAGYDIFSCCMLLILLECGNLRLKPEDSRTALQEQLKRFCWSKEFKDVIWCGLNGEYNSIKPFMQQLDKNKFAVRGRKQYLQ